MQILKKGKKPGDAVHNGTCSHCKTEVEFMRSEGTTSTDPRDGVGLVSVDCPICDQKIYSTIKD